MTTGYALREQAHSLLDTEPDDDARTDEHDQWLQRVCEWADATEDKIAAYRHVRQAALAREAEAKAEAAVWAAVQRRARGVVARIDGLVETLMIATREIEGRTRIDFSGGHVRLQASPPSLQLDVLPEALPREYLRETVTVDRAAIRAVLIAGGEVDGARLVHGEHLRWG